jgi:hypothetical protein
MVTVAIARLDLSATYLREGGAPIEDPKAARRMRMIALVLEGVSQAASGGGEVCDGSPDFASLVAW